MATSCTCGIWVAQVQTVGKLDMQHPRTEFIGIVILPRYLNLLPEDGIVMACCLVRYLKKKGYLKCGSQDLSVPYSSLLPLRKTRLATQLRPMVFTGKCMMIL